MVTISNGLSFFAQNNIKWVSVEEVEYLDYSKTSMHRFSVGWKTKAIHAGKQCTRKPLKIIDKNNLMIIIISC
jgi:hypothetical protein